MLSSSLFIETAEDLVNRLCQEWLDEGCFDDTDPLIDQEGKDMMVRAVRKLDRIIKKREDEGKFKYMNSTIVGLKREIAVAKRLATIFSTGVAVYRDRLTTPPPRPNHRQKRHHEVAYLKVVNG